MLYWHGVIEGHYARVSLGNTAACGLNEKLQLIHIIHRVISLLTPQDLVLSNNFITNHSSPFVFCFYVYINLCVHMNTTYPYYKNKLNMSTIYIYMSTIYSTHIL